MQDIREVSELVMRCALGVVLGGCGITSEISSETLLACGGGGDGQVNSCGLKGDSLDFADDIVICS